MIESVPSRASRSTFRKTRIQEHEMGKGDRKTAKGKRYNSSYGNARTHVATKATGAASAPVAKTAAKRTTRAPAKKERKSGVSGKRGSGRVAIGVRREIKKK